MCCAFEKAGIQAVKEKRKIEIIGML